MRDTRARARARVDAQETKSDGEQEAACTKPDGTQVPAEEAEECTYHLVHPVWVRGLRHSTFLPCGCGAECTHCAIRVRAVKRLEKNQEVIEQVSLDFRD